MFAGCAESGGDDPFNEGIPDSGGGWLTDTGTPFVPPTSSQTSPSTPSGSGSFPSTPVVYDAGVSGSSSSAGSSSSSSGSRDAGSSSSSSSSTPDAGNPLDGILSGLGGLLGDGGAAPANDGGAVNKDGGMCAEAICFDVFDCYIFHPDKIDCGFTACDGFVCK